MKITLITVGKIKEKYLRDAIAEYSKRLSRYCKLEIVEVADEKTPDKASEAEEAQIKEKGYTLVPLQVYFKGSLVKVEIGLARGKKLYDKRQDIAKKDQRREAERDFKVKNLY